MNSEEIKWVVVDEDRALATQLATDAGVPLVIARILINRGVLSAEEAIKFLDPKIEHLHDPYLLPDMERGVERIAAAIQNNEKICVHGDYDVDGVTSTALLVRALRALNANVTYRLPHRQREGYGIKSATVEALAADKTDLIVTCDCGICAHDAIAKANKAGIDVIVTDHHEPDVELPPALAVIDPKRNDHSYPFTELAGVGVAFKFAQALVRKLGHSEESFQKGFLDLAALGTVGDVVPLYDENRAIVTHGLSAIPRSKKIGLQTMLRHSNLSGKPVTAYMLGFVLGPRINAVGRMDDAAIALRLMLTKDENEARELMREMEQQNADRRVEQERILAEAVAQAESKDLSRTSVIVLSSPGWNTGVIGIVAGRICEMFGRPAILIGRDDEAEIGHGSARSIPEFNMIEGLHLCSDLLGRFGGHTLAAGLSIPTGNIESFEEAINDVASQMIPEEAFIPRIELDAELDAAEIDNELAELLTRLEPFGTGNPEPLFMTRRLAVIQRQRVGDGSHMKLVVQGKDTPPISCIAFRQGDMVDQISIGSMVDLCYNIRFNEFNGTRSVQLVVKAIRL